MRKILKLFVILIVSLMLMVACGNDDTSTKNNANENIDSTSETDQTENNDADEGADQEDVENDNTDSANSQTDEVPVLALGETGVIEDTLGTYEVTPKSFWITDSLGEGEDKIIASNGRFVVVEIEIKNIGTEALDLQQITQADLFTETGSASAGYSDYPGLIEFVGEINSNESFVGELAFDNSERDYYELAFGAHMPSYISNEIRWVVNPEDAE